MYNELKNFCAIMVRLKKWNKDMLMTNFKKGKFFGKVNFSINFWYHAFSKRVARRFSFDAFFHLVSTI